MWEVEAGKFRYWGVGCSIDGFEGRRVGCRVSGEKGRVQSTVVSPVCRAMECEDLFDISEQITPMLTVTNVSA